MYDLIAFLVEILNRGRGIASEILKYGKCMLLMNKFPDTT
jgi:hypothetical protein